MTAWEALGELSTKGQSSRGVFCTVGRAHFVSSIAATIVSCASSNATRGMLEADNERSITYLMLEATNYWDGDGYSIRVDSTGLTSLRILPDGETYSVWISSADSSAIFADLNLIGFESLDTVEPSCEYLITDTSLLTLTLVDAGKRTDVVHDFGCFGSPRGRPLLGILCRVQRIDLIAKWRKPPKFCQDPEELERVLSGPPRT
jgi:hypothetical protein